LIRYTPHCAPLCCPVLLPVYAAPWGLVHPQPLPVRWPICFCRRDVCVKIVGTTTRVWVFASCCARLSGDGRLVHVHAVASVCLHSPSSCARLLSFFLLTRVSRLCPPLLVHPCSCENASRLLLQLLNDIAQECVDDSGVILWIVVQIDILCAMLRRNVQGGINPEFCEVEMSCISYCCVAGGVDRGSRCLGSSHCSDQCGNLFVSVSVP